MRNVLLNMGLALMGTASAALVTNCPFNNQLCYSVSVPSSTASKGSGDIFFQVQAPADYTWAALGQGSQMAGANIFVIYADSNGKNVTLSPRLGTGHVEPQYDSNAKVELLEGSGISNGLMVANVRCSNCNSWNGGTMDFTDSSSSWICSYKSGSALDSNSMSAEIEQHDQHGNIQFDLTKAAGGSDSINPFVSSSGNSTSPSSGGSGSSGSSGDGDSDGDSGSSSSTGGDADYSMLSMATIAHGTIMGLSMVIMLPVGALLRRVAPRTSIWVHAGWQSFSLLLVTAGSGLGIWVALQRQQLSSSIAHTIIGLVVFSGLWLQPAFGLLQHSHFKKQGYRGPFGFVHIAWGTSLILLGIINGGLGLQLADQSNQGTIAYAVIAAILGVAYAGIIVFTGISKRKTSAREKNNGEMRSSS